MQVDELAPEPQYPLGSSITLGDQVLGVNARIKGLITTLFDGHPFQRERCLALCSLPRHSGLLPDLLRLKPSPQLWNQYEPDGPRKGRDK